MPTLKDVIQNDIKNVFMNDLEFAENMNINDKSMKAIIDNIEQLEREKRYSSKQDIDGIFKKRIMLYVSESEFGMMPAINSQVKIEKDKYKVKDAINEDGILSVTLEAIKS